MVSIQQPLPRVIIDGISYPGEMYDRCEVCEGRFYGDGPDSYGEARYRLDEYDWWCGCPLTQPESAAWALGSPCQDESGLACWYSPDGEHIYKPYPSPDLNTPTAAFPGPKKEPLFVWPNNLEAGRDRKKISVQEQAARYREIKRILWATGMTTKEKLALIENYEMTGLYPGTIISGGCIEPVSINMGALGKRMGCNAETAGRAIQSLADNGLLVRTERYEDGTGHKIISTAPARRLGFDEVLHESERKIRDRGYRRCSSCGSERVEVRHICHSCGAVEITAPPADADSERSGTGPEKPTDENTVGSPTLDLSVSDTVGSPTDQVERMPTDESSVGSSPEDLSAFYAAILLDACEEAGLALKLSDEQPPRILAWPPAVLTERPDLGLAITEYRDAVIQVLAERDRAFEAALPPVELGVLPQRLQASQGTLFSS